MQFTKCSHNPRLPCSRNNERTCPFKAAKFILEVERWALKSGDLRSMDPSVAIGSLSKHRTNAGQESRALEAAFMFRLFDDPDAVLDWLQAGSVRRASIPKAVCDDLKQAALKWKTGTDKDGKQARDAQNDSKGATKEWGEWYRTQGRIYES